MSNCEGLIITKCVKKVKTTTNDTLSIRSKSMKDNGSYGVVRNPRKTVFLQHDPNGTMTKKNHLLLKSLEEKENLTIK